MHPDDWGCGMWTFVVVLILSFIISVATTCESHKYSTEALIASVRGEVGVEGHFSIFSGSVDSNWYYFYMLDLSGGRYQMGKCLANATTIQESDMLEPRIQTLYNEITFTLFWLLPMEATGSHNPVGYNIVVPVGTVIESYLPQGTRI